MSAASRDVPPLAEQYGPPVPAWTTFSPPETQRLSWHIYVMNLFKPIVILVMIAAASPWLTVASDANGRRTIEPEGEPTALELAQPRMRRLSDDVWVGKVGHRLWVHTTTKRYPNGAIYPANGMLLETAHGSILFDTGWQNSQTRTLLDWAEHSLRKPVVRAIITHAHEDRLGGIGELKQRRIPVFSLALTSEITKSQRVTNDLTPLPGLETRILTDRSGYELYYPGVGHSKDNIVVYFRSQRIMFGGCLVKSVTAPTLGNLDDAVLSDWPNTITRLRNNYPRARIVVPGHGTLKGDPLERTLELLKIKGVK